MSVGSVVHRVAWILSRRAYSRHHLASYLRMAKIRARYPSVRFEGLVFIGPDVRIEAREGYGRVIVGPYTHFVPGSRVRSHEGTLRIGSKTIIGAGVTINSWLDVEIGDGCLIGDDAYICDFDHRGDSNASLMKDQGIVKSPVKIGDDVWLATKVTVLRGTRIGSGSIVAANCVARGDFPAYSVIAGQPGRVVKSRDHEAVRLAQLDAASAVIRGWRKHLSDG